MRLVLLGAPGSGKGTQAGALAARLAVPVISTGELLRAQVEAGAPRGREVAVRLDRGDLVPDDAIIAIVRDATAGAGDRGYILDGFPRTVAQAEHPDAPPVDAVVHLDLPDDVARQRLAARDEGRSDDADAAVIEHRLREYHAETEPLLDSYRRAGVLRSVDAARRPSEVTAAIVEAITNR